LGLRRLLRRGITRQERGEKHGDRKGKKKPVVHAGENTGEK
jgi:hypothetical protein